MTDHLVWGLRRVRDHTLRLLSRFSSSRATEQSVSGEPHPAWIVGHLCLGDAYLLSLLGSALPTDFRELLRRYGPGAEPVGQGDHYDPFDALVDRLVALGNERHAVVSRMTDEHLRRPLPDETLARAQPTFAHHLQALIAHEGYHAGQLASWRRAHGLPSVPWAFATPAE